MPSTESPCPRTNLLAAPALAAGVVEILPDSVVTRFSIILLSENKTLVRLLLESCGNSKDPGGQKET
jgi:hypothetical protein